jgi:cytochrome c-type biogenesis protein
VAADTANTTLLAAFGGGLLSFASPCVLPLVPSYLSLMSGVNLGVDGAPVATTARVLRSTLLFVAGFTIVFVLLGLAATGIGRTLQAHQRALEDVSGVLILVLGLFLAGVWTPAALQRERRVQVLPSRLGPFAAPVMGMAFAFGWTPCIGPILGGVLTIAGDQARAGRGAVLLFAYSLGLGVPFVASALATERLATAFGAIRRHLHAVNVVAGLVLAAFGLLLLMHRVGWLSTQLQHLLRTLHLGWLSTI